MCVSSMKDYFDLIVAEDHVPLRPDFKTHFAGYIAVIEQVGRVHVCMFFFQTLTKHAPSAKWKCH